MNEEALKDLKQFITTTVRQEISGVNERIDGVDEKINSVREEVASVREEIASLETRINTRFDENDVVQNEILNAIGEVQELQNKAIRRQADTIDNHEIRILKLEKRTA